MQDPQQQDPLTQEPIPELTPEQQQEYEELKQRNRRRLVGAGAITLLVGGLFAAIAGSNSSDNQKQPTLTEASAPNLSTAQTTTEPMPMASAPVLANQPRDVLPINAASSIAVASEPVVAGNNASVPTSELGYDENALVATHIASENLETAPTVVQESHRRRLEEEASKQRRENSRLAAQERLRQSEAERAERERAIAERARQAQNSAEQKRIEERKRLAQQKAAERKQEQVAQAKAKTPTTPTATAPKATASGSGHFAVQAGAFGNKAQADKVRSQVAALGYGASVSTVKTAKGTLYRVQATGFTNRNAAQAAAAKMKARGLGGMVVGK